MTQVLYDFTWFDLECIVHFRRCIIEFMHWPE
jgi:hypothetical protein